MANVLNLMGSERCLVVHGEEGADELTLGAENHVWELRDGNVSYSVINPRDLGLVRAPWQAIRGGKAADNAFIAASDSHWRKRRAQGRCASEQRCRVDGGRACRRVCPRA